MPGNTELIIGLLVFITFMFFYWLLRRKYFQQDVAIRLKAAGSKGQQHLPQKPGKATIEASYEAGVSEIFDMSTASNRSEYKVLFEQAGWNIKNAQRNIILIKLALSIGCVFLAIFAITFFNKLYIQPVLIKFLIIIFAAIIGIFFYDRIMKFIIHRRYNRILKDLYASLELLVICSRAGMGIEKAMERVSQEVSQYNPDLAREFYITSLELEIIPNRKTAYENLRRRVEIPLVYGMTTTLIQAEEQGSSISESLKVLSDEFRMQLVMEIEKKAARLPALLSIPVILFTLPTLIAVIVGPAIIKIMSNTSVLD